MVALCKMLSGLVFIGVELELLLVDRVMWLSLILLIFVFDVEIIGGSALDVEISWFLGEFLVERPMKDYGK